MLWFVGLGISGTRSIPIEVVKIIQEADFVYLEAFTSPISKQDEEHRVWYVGVTRTKQNLFLIRGKDRRKEYKI